MGEQLKIDIQRADIDYLLMEDLECGLGCFGFPMGECYIEEGGNFLLFHTTGSPAHLPPVGTDFLAITWKKTCDSLMPMRNSREMREAAFWGLVIHLPAGCTHIGWQRKSEMFGNLNNGFGVMVPVPLPVSQNFLLMVEIENPRALGVEVSYAVAETNMGTIGVVLTYEEEIPPILIDEDMYIGN